MTLPKFWHLKDCVFNEVRGGDAYCSFYKKIGEFDCKNCPYMIFKSTANSLLIDIAKEKARLFGLKVSKDDK